MKILIFDLDGTIADTFKFAHSIVNRLAKEFNFKELLSEEMEAMKGKTVQEIIRHLGVPVVKLPLIITRAHQELYKEIDQLQPIKGLREILIEISKLGYKMGIITSNSKKNVTRFLEQHEIRVFDFIISYNRILGKSYQIKTLLKHDKIDKKDALYIGDEIRDIEASKKAGIKIAAVSWGFNSASRLLEYKPDFLIHNPTELLQICKSF
ncbi:MAG: HAD-IA family hydrolase [Calditrichaeota bacterium]|nr:HAD-IA family hydrolase [Calditrichota bacterium]